MKRRDMEIGALCVQLVGMQAVAECFASATTQAKAALRADPARVAASVAIPLESFAAGLPAELAACRVSVMRGGVASPIERHPNAVQYVLSLHGDGAIRVKQGERWRVSRLRSEGALADRWHVVPMSAWHQPEPGAEDWVVAAFHSVAARELLDDYDYRA